MNGRPILRAALAAAFVTLIVIGPGCASGVQQRAAGNSALEHLRAGNEHYRAGHWDAASEDYQRVLETDPANVDVLFRLGVIAYRRGRMDEALDRFERVREIDPEDPGAAYNTAVIHLQRAQGAIAHVLALSGNNGTDGAGVQRRADRLEPVFRAIEEFRVADER